MNVYWPTGEPIEPTPAVVTWPDCCQRLDELETLTSYRAEVDRLRGVIERLEIEKHNLAERLGDGRCHESVQLPLNSGAWRCVHPTGHSGEHLTSNGVHFDLLGGGS